LSPAQFQRQLSTLLEQGLVSDAVIVQSGREHDGLWAVREELVPGLQPLRPFQSHHVSMSLS